MFHRHWRMRRKSTFMPRKWRLREYGAYVPLRLLFRLLWRSLRNRYWRFNIKSIALVCIWKENYVVSKYLTVSRARLMVSYKICVCLIKTIAPADANLDPGGQSGFLSDNLLTAILIGTCVLLLGILVAAVIIRKRRAAARKTTAAAIKRQQQQSATSIGSSQSVGSAFSVGSAVSVGSNFNVWSVKEHTSVFCVKCLRLFESTAF